MALVVVGLNSGYNGTSTTDLPASSLFFRNLAIAGNTDPAASVVAADGAGTTGLGKKKQRYSAILELSV